jgi:hypothetical protein
MSRKPFSACAILLHAYTLHAKDNTFRPVTRYAKYDCQIGPRKWSTSVVGQKAARLAVAGVSSAVSPIAPDNTTTR